MNKWSNQCTLQRNSKHYIGMQKLKKFDTRMVIQNSIIWITDIFQKSTNIFFLLGDLVLFLFEFLKTKQPLIFSSCQREKNLGKTLCGKHVAATSFTLYPLVHSSIKKHPATIQLCKTQLTIPVLRLQYFSFWEFDV